MTATKFLALVESPDGEDNGVELGTHAGAVKGYREMVHEIGKARAALQDAKTHVEFIRKEAEKEATSVDVQHIATLCDRALQVLDAEVSDENEAQAGIPTI